MYPINLDNPSAAPTQVRYQPFCGKSCHLDDMVMEGVIGPGYRPWPSPFCLVEKKPKKLRFVVDFCQLNAVTTEMAYLLPQIDDISDIFLGIHFSTTLDMTSGYRQVSLDRESKKKTGFIASGAHWQFKVVPLGLSNARSVFQNLINTVLSGCLCDFCIAYINDEAISSKTLKDHVN